MALNKKSNSPMGGFFRNEHGNVTLVGFAIIPLVLAGRWRSIIAGCDDPWTTGRHRRRRRARRDHAGDDGATVHDRTDGGDFDVGGGGDDQRANLRIPRNSP